MKKLTMILLCLMLAILCAQAGAETAEKTRLTTLNVDNAFVIQGLLPEGYAVVPYQTDEGRYIALLGPVGENTGRPEIVISIAYDELLSDVGRLNDLDDEALAQIEATFREEDDVDITYRETAYGTKVMVVRLLGEDGASVKAVDFYTIYLGFEIEIVMVPGTGTGGSITEEQIDMAIAFLSDMDFVPAE